MEVEVLQLVKELELLAHPEGGYYKEVYRSDQSFIPAEIGSSRCYATSILFLLGAKDVSHFHSIKSDEIWYYHAGDPCLIHVLLPNGKLLTHALGSDIQKGQVLQVMVPAGAIFASESSGVYSLVGCMVAPGFDFQDFNLFTTFQLVDQYPQHRELIKKFTKEKY